MLYIVMYKYIKAKETPKEALTMIANKEKRK